MAVRCCIAWKCRPAYANKLHLLLAVVLRARTCGAAAQVELLSTTGIAAHGATHAASDGATSEVSSTGVSGYQMNQTSRWGVLWDSFSVTGPRSEDIGIIERAFPGSEVNFFSSKGKTLATARRSIMSGDTEFFDSEGRLTAKLRGFGWNWLSTPSLCEWLSGDGQLLGLARRIDFAWVGAQAVVVEDVEGSIVARLFQHRFGTASFTDLKLLGDVDMMSRAGHPLADFRVLALFASLHVGAGFQMSLMYACSFCSVLLCLATACYCQRIQCVQAVDTVPYSPIKEKSIALALDKTQHGDTDSGLFGTVPLSSRSFSRSQHDEAERDRCSQKVALELQDSQRQKRGASAFSWAMSWMSFRKSHMKEDDEKDESYLAQRHKQDWYMLSARGDSGSEDGDDQDFRPSMFSCGCNTKPSHWKELLLPQHGSGSPERIQNMLARPVVARSVYMAGNY